MSVTIVTFFAGMLVGVIFAVVVGTLLTRMEGTHGILHVDVSDPEGPYMFLELTEQIDAILQEEEVLLAVDVKNYLSA